MEEREQHLKSGLSLYSRLRLWLRIAHESVLQALGQLRSNKLRTSLSLLGVCIGIFCIVGVQSAVSSLESSVRDSFSKLGDDVIYVQKMPWTDDPHTNFWKYMRRPDPSYKDLLAIREQASSVGLADYHAFIGTKTLKYRSNSVSGAFVLAVTYEAEKLFSIDFYKGRYFQLAEYEQGMNKVVLGYKVAKELFGDLEPVGKKIKMLGQRFEVVGVVAPSGDDLVQIMNWDEAVILPFETARKVTNVERKTFFGSVVIVKPKEGVPLEKMKEEVRGILRARRHLKPLEEDNFALNNVSVIASFMDSFFGVLNSIGLIVGGFAMFVGMFSVANIMFVSVKERTRLIGIKKAIGAKSFFILLEFLIEAVMLCLIGGAMGLLLVFLILKLLSGMMPYDIYLSANNILFGLALSTVVGVLSGIIPALQAARMDPVVAMRK